MKHADAILRAIKTLYPNAAGAMLRAFEGGGITPHAKTEIENVALAIDAGYECGLNDAASRLPSIVLLLAPCLWCGYNGTGYWGSGSHAPSCRWHGVAGESIRLRLLEMGRSQG